MTAPRSVGGPLTFFERLQRAKNLNFEPSKHDDFFGTPRGTPPTRAAVAALRSASAPPSPPGWAGLRDAAQKLEKASAAAAATPTPPAVALDPVKITTEDGVADEMAVDPSAQTQSPTQQYTWNAPVDSPLPSTRSWNNEKALNGAAVSFSPSSLPNQTAAPAQTPVLVTPAKPAEMAKASDSPIAITPAETQNNLSATAKSNNKMNATMSDTSSTRTQGIGTPLNEVTDGENGNNNQHELDNDEALTRLHKLFNKDFLFMEDAAIPDPVKEVVSELGTIRKLLNVVLIGNVQRINQLEQRVKELEKGAFDGQCDAHGHIGGVRLTSVAVDDSAHGAVSGCDKIFEEELNTSPHIKEESEEEKEEKEQPQQQVDSPTFSVAVKLPNTVPINMGITNETTTEDLFKKVQDEMGVQFAGCSGTYRMQLLKRSKHLSSYGITEGATVLLYPRY